MDIKKTYTKEEIIVAASFCKDLEDFKTRYWGIYEFIEGSDQLDKMFSYEPVTLNRAVYVFEFSNGTAYVGLSYNIQRRYS